MNRYYSFVLFLLLFVSVFLVLNSYLLFDSLSSPTATAHASSQGTVAFTVESNETTTPGGGTGGSGGGGGGGGGGTTTEPQVGFSVSDDEFNILVPSGNLEVREFTVENTGDSELVIDLEISGIVGFASLSTDRITLASGGKKLIILTIIAPEPGVYAGKVVLKSGNIRKDLLILLNVRSDEKSLFDVSLDIPESFKTLQEGDIVKAFISLLQVGDAEEVDVTADYVVKDFEGNTIFTESETFRVLREKSFVKEFSTKGFAAGDYVVGIEIKYPDGFASSSSHFRIVEEEGIDFMLIGIIIAVLAALAVIIYSIIRYKNSKGSRKKRKKSR